MINYYEVLGLKKDASFTEIKTAFRNLAKLYHPDKNVSGKDQFEIILKAYETLSNPKLKLSYDYKLNYILSTHQINTLKTVTKKNWSIDEKEIKRRKYYDEYIKKYEKQKVAYKQEVKEKKQYNEFKYILYATPIAACLFLLIFYLASTPSSNINQQQTPLQVTKQQQPQSTLKMGDAPYCSYFGYNRYDTISDCKLIINNNTPLELIVCLFRVNQFIRCCYINKNYYVELQKLPKDSLVLKYSCGTNFSYTKNVDSIDVLGCFNEHLNFYESIYLTNLNATKEINIDTNLNHRFKKINARIFFKK